MAKYVVFVLLSFLLIIISWRSLFHPGSHGFWRFLSWECILWLGISNYKYWFMNPISLNQIISVLSAIFLIMTAKIEEMENIRFFGEKYLDYRNKTSMFVPFLF
ncbi:MAG TPA: hypothetical protein VJ346_04700 [Bacteroidales bacterium]|nr:hypothetical protein [Bacteroidales bacterium]